MYKIIGADQKEYGPITAEQMQKWITEGRVNPQTLVWSEAVNNWKPLASYPEFAANLPSGGVIPPFGGGLDSLAAEAMAAERVSGPAVGLMVTGALTILTAVVLLIMNLFNVAVLGMGTPTTGTGSDPQTQRLIYMFSGALGAFSRILSIVIGGFIFYGGMKMKKLENHGLCLGASIVAMVPCLSPCCIIGIPIGIWALTTINKPEIKSQFH